MVKPAYLYDLNTENTTRISSRREVKSVGKIAFSPPGDSLGSSRRQQEASSGGNK